jgi:hypothetical protein
VERIAAAEVAFAEVVDALTAAGGGSFAAIPPFAAVVREGEHARIAVRGRVRARCSPRATSARSPAPRSPPGASGSCPAMTGSRSGSRDG